jgi:hypothetical protein
MKSLSATIRRMITHYGVTPEEINNGLCEDFADSVMAEMGYPIRKQTNTRFVQADPFDQPDEFGNKDVAWPGHFWIVWDGKHYDAECPDGVDCWHDLPLFARWIAAKKLVLSRVMKHPKQVHAPCPVKAQISS